MFTAEQIAALADNAQSIAHHEYVEHQSGFLRKGRVRIRATGETGNLFWLGRRPAAVGGRWPIGVAMSEDKDPSGRYSNVRWLDVAEVAMDDVDTESEYARICIRDRAASIFDRLFTEARNAREGESL